MQVVGQHENFVNLVVAWALKIVATPSTATISLWITFFITFLVVQVVAKHENANSREYLDSLVESMHRILKMLDPAPSVQLQVRAPHTDSYVFQINKSSERYFSYAKYRSHEVPVLEDFLFKKFTLNKL